MWAAKPEKFEVNKQRGVRVSNVYRTAYMHIHTYIQTDGLQTYERMDGQDIQTDRHTDRQRQTYIQTYIHTYIHTDRHTDRQTYRQTDRQANRLINRTINGRTAQRHSEGFTFKFFMHSFIFSNYRLLVR